MKILLLTLLRIWFCFMYRQIIHKSMTNINITSDAHTYLTMRSSCSFPSNTKSNVLVRPGNNRVLVVSMFVFALQVTS